MFKSRKNGFFKAACLGVALLASAPAFANVTRVSELVDVDPNIWAYKALKELVEKYDVFEGYPDRTFKGNKAATRYELAQALYEVLKVVDVMDSKQVSGADLETLGKLKRQFDRELADVRNKVASLEGRVSALEADANNYNMAAPVTWTDRIKVSGDLTNQFRQDWNPGGGGNERDAASWGTRARLGVDAILIGQDPSNTFLGEGIAHIRINAGNGGPGTYNYTTAGNNLDDILSDSSNPGFHSNNSLYAGRGGDSRMDAYLEQAYYTQVFKFQKTDACSNEVEEYPNFFAVADLGQQDLWNTFHKSLVREDSLDGFMNQRILHGVVGASDATTEAFHLGLNWLGSGTEGERVDSCGNPISDGVDSCGNPLPGFFQAFSLDYALAAHKDLNVNGGQTGVFTTNRVNDNLSHNFGANLLYDLPGQLLGTGLFSTGVSIAHLDWNNNPYAPLSGVAATTGAGDKVSFTTWAKLEQYFGINRTFGIFLDYAWADHNSTNRYLQGPVRNLVQAGMLLNTTFLPETWNFNKDQMGFAYSFADMHSGVATATLAAFPTSSVSGVNNTLFYGVGNRGEHAFEAYYRKYITENISITPDVILQINPNGTNQTAISGAVRTTFKLPNWNDGGAFDQFGYRDWSQRLAKFRASRNQLEM